MAHDFYTDALAALDSLREERADIASLAAYHQAVLESQKKTREAIQSPIAEADQKALADRSEEGLSLLVPTRMTMDWAGYDALFDQLAVSAREHADTASENEWTSIQAQDDAWHNALLEKLLDKDADLGSFAEALAMDPPTFSFLAVHALTPFLEACADVLLPLTDVEKWLKGQCPICGGAPIMGMLEKEAGRRILECSCCRTRWPFTRIECPSCGNDDQSSLRFFTDEEDPAHRVEVCDKCRAYLKTVDARQLDNEVILPAEDVATMHLDIVAKQEDFHRNTNMTLGFN